LVDRQERTEMAKDPEGNVYIAHAKGTDLYKIGYTSRHVEERISGLQTGCPHELELLKAYKGSIRDEKEVHMMLTGCWVRGEWFKLPRKTIEIWLPRIEQAIRSNEGIIDLEDGSKIGPWGMIYEKGDGRTIRSPWLNARQAALYCGYSTAETIRNAVREGDLSPDGTRGKMLFHIETIKKWNPFQ